MAVMTEDGLKIQLHGPTEENWKDAFFYRISVNEARMKEKINLLMFALFVLVIVGILIISEQSGRISDLEHRLKELDSQEVSITKE